MKPVSNRNKNISRKIHLPISKNTSYSIHFNCKSCLMRLFMGNNIYCCFVRFTCIVWALLLKYPSATTADGDKSNFINSVVLVQQQLQCNRDEPFFTDNELILNPWPFVWSWHRKMKYVRLRVGLSIVNFSPFVTRWRQLQRRNGKRYFLLANSKK